MRNKRYRLYYGETHEEVQIADDVDRCYLWGFQVDRLNEYDEKTNVMESKLNELGYELVFIREDYNMMDKGFETSISKNPNPNDNGEWKVITLEEYENFKDKMEGCDKYEENCL